MSPFGDRDSPTAVGHAQGSRRVLSPHIRATVLEAECDCWPKNVESVLIFQKDIFRFFFFDRI